MSTLKKKDHPNVHAMAKSVVCVFCCFPKLSCKVKTTFIPKS